MTSPFAMLFLAIQQRIAAITDNDSNPLFTFIDQDLGQLEDNTRGMNRPPVSWPCALIDIDDSNFSNISANAQEGVVNCCIRIGFPPFSSTEMKTPAPYKNKALFYYDLEQAAVLSIHGWSPTTVIIDDTTDPITTADISGIFGHLIRTRIVKEDRTDLLRVRCLMFTLSMDDLSTQDAQDTATVTALINMGINIPS